MVIYEELCESRQYARGSLPSAGLRKHYIRPKSLGGSDTSENVVYLTPKEQWVAKRLLTKFTVGFAKYKCLRELSELAKSYPDYRLRTIGRKAFEIAAWMRKTYWKPRLTEAHKIAIGNAIRGIRRPGTGPNMWGSRNVNWGKFGEKHHNYGKKWKVQDTSKYAEARREYWRKRHENEMA